MVVLKRQEEKDDGQKHEPRQPARRERWRHEKTPTKQALWQAHGPRAIKVPPRSERHGMANRSKRCDGWLLPERAKGVGFVSGFAEMPLRRFALASSFPPISPRQGFRVGNGFRVSAAFLAASCSVNSMLSSAVNSVVRYFTVPFRPLGDGWPTPV